VYSALAEAIMTDEQARIRSYLVSQAAKLTPATIVEKVQAAMADLAAAAKTIPASRFTERPAPEEWSGNEVMAHVLAADRYFGGGVIAILEGRPPTERGEGRGIENAPQRTAVAWFELLEAQRAPLFAGALGAEPSIRLDRTIEHPFFGPLNWRETLLFTRLHDLDHAGQLRKNAEAFH
jgi:hypothetical protein